MAGRPDPGRARTDTRRDLEEVVRLSGRSSPSTTLVGRDLQLCSAAVCVDDLS